MPDAAQPIPEEAVEAAAEAMEDAAMRWLGCDLGTIHRDDIARDALAAAFPLLRAQIADEIMRERGDVDRDEPRLYERGVAYGMSVASRVARGEQP